MRKPAEIRLITDRVSLERLEALVDEAIDRSSMCGAWPAEVQVKDYPGRLVAQIVSGYRLHGWTIDYISDQRGIFLLVHQP